MPAANAYVAIVKALRETLLTVEGLPPEDRREWQNRTFTLPDPPAEWVRYTFDPGRPEVASLGPKATMRAEGIFMIDWFFPRGGGMNPPLLAGGRVLDAFSPRVDCVADGQSVSIRRSYISRPIPDGAWLHVPITVEWRADYESPI